MANTCSLREQDNVVEHFLPSHDWWILPLQGGAPICTGARAFARRQGIAVGPFEMPHPADWIGDKILFSAKLGDAVDLWAVPIRYGRWQITGKAEHVTSSIGIAVSPSATSDGRIVFANLESRTHLWMLPMDTRRGIVKGAPKEITDSAADEYWPSVSRDGTRLAFTSTRNGKEDIWLKDLRTGSEMRIPFAGDAQEFPKFSHDGRRLAFTGVGEQKAGVPKASTYVLSLNTMRSQKVLEKGDWVWDWSPDDRYLLFKRGLPRYIESADVASGRTAEFFRDPHQHIFQVTFSPNGRWLAFLRPWGIFVAPYHGHGGIPKQEWIPTTVSRYLDDKPRWSPDGSLIYFLSHRDGWACLWMQHLNPATKAAVGEPVPVYHFHSATRSIGNVGAGLEDIAVSSDGVIFPQTELKGNIWMTTARK